MQRTVHSATLLLAMALSIAGASAHAREPRSEMGAGLPLAKIPAGTFTPLYRPSTKVSALPVAAFRLMTRPVTNAEFLAFVTDDPSHRRGQLARVFADEQYLAHWQGPLALGEQARAAQPVTHVSWFAGKAFCEAHGLRLPTEAEWELAAAASATRRNGGSEPRFRQQLLAWYSAPRGELPDVPHGPANVYGVRDLHGVIWEWVEDFNNAVVLEDARGGSDANRDRFCGAGALTVQDTLDYAAFMRVAMRSSLEADYTGALLGFRCAADGNVPEGKRP